MLLGRRTKIVLRLDPQRNALKRMPQNPSWQKPLKNGPTVKAQHLDENVPHPLWHGNFPSSHPFWMIGALVT